MAGPLLIDPHQEQRVREITWSRYKDVSLRSIQWCGSLRIYPYTVEEWDDLVVNFKNDPDVGLSRPDFAYLNAAVAFYFPRFRGQLHWCHAV